MNGTILRANSNPNLQQPCLLPLLRLSYSFTSFVNPPSSLLPPLLLPGVRTAKMRTTRFENDAPRISRSGSEHAKQEALSLMAQGEQEDPAWNMDSLKTAILFAEVEGVKEVFARSTFRPRTPGFTTLINFFGRLRDWRRAQEVFRAMTSECEVAPNTFSYSALISACSSSGEWERALEIFQEMKHIARNEEGSSCQPNAVTYSAVMTACERGGQCERAVQIYYDMQAEAVEPDQGTYTVAVSSCLATEGWREVEMILQDMHKKNFTAPVALYGDLVAKYSQCGEWQKALDVFLSIQMVGVSVDIHICRNLMASLEKADRPGNSVDLLRAMRDGGIEIDLETYNSALRALAENGLYAQAMAVFQSITEEKLAPDVYSVAALVKAHINGGQMDEADKLKNDYKANGLDIDNPIIEDVDATFLASCSIHDSGSPSD